MFKPIPKISVENIYSILHGFIQLFANGFRTTSLRAKYEVGVLSKIILILKSLQSYCVGIILYIFSNWGEGFRLSYRIEIL